MARAGLTDLKEDLITDAGAVLWSFVQGEQLEFPVTISFIENAATPGFQYEAVVMEGLNTVGQEEKPTDVRPAGVNTQLVVRIPTDRGTWDFAQAYNREDFVLYSGKYYKLESGTARVNSTPPDQDSEWVAHSPNIIYIQYAKTLSVTPAWTVGPSVSSPVYGFFELRVTEPPDAVFTRTWKPIRGMVEIHYSPTEVVA
jgi:hypothetical protein